MKGWKCASRSMQHLDRTFLRSCSIRTFEMRIVHFLDLILLSSEIFQNDSREGWLQKRPSFLNDYSLLDTALENMISLSVQIF